MLRDRGADTTDRRADILAASLSYGQPAIVATARIARPVSPRSRYWRDGLTALIWSLDVDGDRTEDMALLLWHNGYRPNAVELRDRTGKLLCYGSGARRGDLHIARVEQRCFAGAPPAQLAFQVFMQFHKDPARTGRRAFAFDAAPNRAFSAPVRRPPFRTSLTLETYSDGIAYGDEVTFAGRLGTRDVNPVGVEDQWVELFARRPGGRWRRTAVVQTDHMGDWRVTLQPAATTEYQARFHGNDLLAPVNSVRHRVEVERHIVVETETWEQPLGHESTVRGWVFPVDAPAVRLQRRTAAGWETVATASPREDGEFRIGVNPARSGTFTYRISVPADDRFVESFSDEPLTANVYAVEVTAVEPGRGDVYDTADPNAEYIEIRNAGTVSVWLYAWAVEADALRSAALTHDLHLTPGATLRIYSGRGTPMDGTLYLNRATPLWPDSGGTARLLNVDDVVVDEMAYAARGPLAGAAARD